MTVTLFYNCLACDMFLVGQVPNVIGMTGLQLDTVETVLCLQNVGAFAERSSVEMSKTEWMDTLQRLQVTRTDMNRLVMNYLVTGLYCT
jgi:hypothetical protein